MGFTSDVQKGVTASACDGTDHVTLPCDLTKIVIYVCSSGGTSDPFIGWVLAWI